MSEIETSTLAILAGAMGGGGVIGYLTRISQKYEDRKDEIYLKTLPQLYYNLNRFISVTKIFVEYGDVAEYIEKLEDIKKKLNEILSSGAILPSEDKSDDQIIGKKPDLSLKELLEIDHQIGELIVYLNKNKVERKNPGEEDREEQSKVNSINDLKESFGSPEIKKTKSLKVDLFDPVTKTKQINQKIKSSLKGYKSFSWKIVIIISILGGALAGIELLT